MVLNKYFAKDACTGENNNQNCFTKWDAIITFSPENIDVEIMF